MDFTYIRLIVAAQGHDQNKTVNETNTIQENQEISLGVDLLGNVTDSSSLKLRVDFGDGIENETATGRNTATDCPQDRLWRFEF